MKRKKRAFRGRVKDPHRINQHIIADPIRLVGDNVEQGIQPLEVGLAAAKEQELDLSQHTPELRIREGKSSTIDSEQKHLQNTTRKYTGLKTMIINQT